MEENEIISPKCETIAEPECNYSDTGAGINIGSLNRNLLDSDISIGNHKDIEAVDGFPTLNHLETDSSIPKTEESSSNKDAEKVSNASIDSKLESFQNLVKLHFDDSLSSMIVKTSNGSKFISLWNPPTENIDKQSLSMKYLPLFYIIGSFNEDSKCELKLITFHGKIIDELREDSNEEISDESIIKFCDKLKRVKICSGANASNMECKYDLRTVLDTYFIEYLDGNTIIRSRKCSYGLSEENEGNVCNACSMLNCSESRPKRKRTRNKVVKNDVAVLADSSNCSSTDLLTNYIGTEISENDTNLVKEEYLASEEKYYVAEDIAELSMSEEYSFADTEFKAHDTNSDSDWSTQKKRKTSKTHKCKYCSYVGSTKVNLSEHIKEEHSDLKPYSCELCSFKAKDKRALDHHVISTHDQSKAFLCEHCSYSTPSKGRLTCHIKAVHDKFKPFICEHCSFATAAKAHLDNHIAVVHNKIKPFQCTQCPYRAANSRDMKRHVKEVHEKIRPFSCHLCPYRAGRRVLMTKHMTKMHNEHKLPTRKVKYDKVANPNSNLGYYKNKADYDLPEFKKDEIQFQGNS